MREKIDTKTFIQKAKDIHKDEYDYSETIYADSRTKINVICRKHGVFSLLPYTHIKGAQGCPKCTYEQMRLSNGDFIARSNKIHNKELVALRRGTEFRYKPKINFGGETECFSNLEYIENLLEINK